MACVVRRLRTLGPFRAVRHRVVFCLVAACGPGAIQAAPATPEATDMVELPTFTVTDSRVLPPPESWRYAEIKGFEVLSNASDRATNRMIRDFQGFQRAVEIVWPAMRQRTSVPISIILCARRNRFEAFVPKVGPSQPRATREFDGLGTVAVVLDAGTPINEVRADVGLASLFFKDQEQAAIIIDLEASTLNLSTVDGPAASPPETDDDAAPGTANNDFVVDHYKQLYREYLHYLLSRIQPRAPAWFEEGLAQLFMTMRVDRKSIEFARIEDPNLQSIDGAREDRDFNRALQRRALMPLQEFFAVTHDSPVARNNLGSVWAKQAQAFVHMCLYGRGQRHQRAFLVFVTRLQREPPSEALFQECFKMSYAKMLLEMRGYIDFTDYKATDFGAKKGEALPEIPPLVLRDATEAEVGRIKGDALRLGGNAEAARLTLIAPYIRGERDPRLLAALGLAERAAGQDDRARKFLEIATRGKVRRPRAYLELARLRYATAQATPAGPGGKLDGAQITTVFTPLFAALQQPPPMPELYELVADVWMHAAVVPKREHLAVVYEGVVTFPGETELVYRAAVLSAQFGLPDDAAKLVDLGLRTARDDRTRVRFEQIKAKLPPVPTPTPGAKASEPPTSRSRPKP